MNCLPLLLLLLLAACEPKPLETSQSTSSTVVHYTTTDKQTTQAEDSLALFLKIKSPQTNALAPEDTLITFLCDYSFAGWIDAKYIQLYRTNAGVQLTQVFYTNQATAEAEGFELVNVLTGMQLGKVYAAKFKQEQLSWHQWHTLLYALKKAEFLKMGQEACGGIVMDGTYTSLVFHATNNSHQVERHNCPDEAFYQLINQLDHYSPDPLPFHRTTTNGI